MKTILAKVDLCQPEAMEIIQMAAKILQEGGLVAFPTETVYGLGGNGLDGTACEKIYIAKGRPSDNPLILHISEFEELNPIPLLHDESFLPFHWDSIDWHTKLWRFMMMHL